MKTKYKNFNLDTNSLYKKFNQKWLKNNTIFLTVHGSHAYGTNREDSDLDIRGIAIPPKEYYLGNLNNFEQAETKDPYDFLIFDLRKFINLSAKCNPNALELMFIDENEILFCNDWGSELLNRRDLFLSKKVRHTFSGYANSQLKRVKLYRKWLLNPPKKKPERSDFNLPDNKKLIPENQFKDIESAVNKKLDMWIFDSTGLEKDTVIDIKNKLSDILVDLKINTDDYHIYAARSLGLNDNLIEAFSRERRYKQALRQYNNYMEWKNKRNPERFELERKYGYDCKHASHLIRLYLQCSEVLKAGELVVKRPDSQFLREIRDGKWTYEELIDWAEKQDNELDNLYKNSPLPKSCNVAQIDSWLVNFTERFLNYKKNRYLV